MSFENFLPERDGAVAIRRIDQADRLDPLNPIVNQSAHAASNSLRDVEADTNGDVGR